MTPRRIAGCKDNRQLGRERLKRCDKLLSAGDCVGLRSVCVCVRMSVCAHTICSFPLPSMSLCQNKLITITGAKAEIQKFISSKICIVSLSFFCDRVCACVPVPALCVCLAPLAAGTQTHSYLLLCHGFFSPCVVELKCPPSLC